MWSELSKEFRSPTPGSCLGCLAQTAMSVANGVDSIDAASHILISQEGLPLKKPVVVEIGPGAGHALREILETFNPSHVYGIEISKAFRELLENDDEISADIESGVLSLHENDAIDLSFIPSNSVDLIFAFNVIYFLNPLKSYLKEFERILKPDGMVHFGVKEVAKKMDPEVYINTDWDKCLEEMRENGFIDVEAKAQRLEGVVAYTTLLGIK